MHSNTLNIFNIQLEQKLIESSVNEQSNSHTENDYDDIIMDIIIKSIKHDFFSIANDKINNSVSNQNISNSLTMKIGLNVS